MARATKSALVDDNILSRKRASCEESNTMGVQLASALPLFQAKDRDQREEKHF